MPATSKGRFVWHELLTTDIAGAQKFYPQLTGWKIQNWDAGEGKQYPMWVAGETPIGGTMELPEEAKKMGAPPNWLAYISTPDVDATTAQAVELGGKVLNGPFDIPTVGRMSVLADPQGAVFAAFTPSGEGMGRADGAPRLGEFSWHELATTDYAAAFEFYRNLFGWEQQDAPEVMPGMIYQMYGVGKEMYGGMYTKPKEQPGPPAWLHYIQVPSADEAAEKAKQLGGKIVNGPMEVPGGDRVAQGIDPQGAFFAVHSKGLQTAAR
jgi:predicted enzyme related to lactoylglutathione lyase